MIWGYVYYLLQVFILLKTLWQSWHSKLLGEKSRLAFAVQACEAATASISRPGSPQDVISQSIPENELAVRAKLEDLIEQVGIVCICTVFVLGMSDTILNRI